MNKKISIAVLLVVLVALSCLYLYIYKSPATSRNKSSSVTGKETPAALVPEIPAPQAKENPLNLALPQTSLLVDHAVQLPDKQHNLHKLFEESQSADAVSLGGRLLVDENPKPDASMRENVKGAEVGITIKTR